MRNVEGEKGAGVWLGDERKGVEVFGKIGNSTNPDYPTQTVRVWLGWVKFCVGLD